MIRAIIFDGDGVLFDSEKVHVKAWEKIFGKIGVKLLPEDYQRGIGTADREFLRYLIQTGKLPSEYTIEEILEDKFRILLELTGEVTLFPEVRETVEVLSKKYILALASNSRKEFTLKILNQFALREYFEEIITKENTKNPKPSPEIYLLTAQRLRVAPSECVVIEDSPVGIESAKKAGAICLAIPHTLPETSLQKADTILKTLSWKEIEKAIPK